MDKTEDKYTTILRKYPAYRHIYGHAPWLWLASRRVDDGAEGLWRINDSLYDVSGFIEKHPGGKDWLEDTKVSEFFQNQFKIKFIFLFPK